MSADFVGVGDPQVKPHIVILDLKGFGEFEIYLMNLLLVMSDIYLVRRPSAVSQLPSPRMQNILLSDFGSS